MIDIDLSNVTIEQLALGYYLDLGLDDLENIEPLPYDSQILEVSPRKTRLGKPFSHYQKLAAQIHERMKRVGLGHLKTRDQLLATIGKTERIDYVLSILKDRGTMKYDHAAQREHALRLLDQYPAESVAYHVFNKALFDGSVDISNALWHLLADQETGSWHVRAIRAAFDGKVIDDDRDFMLTSDGEYMVVDDDAANSRTAEYIKESLCYFNAWFLAAAAELPSVIFEALVGAEDNNRAILTLIERSPGGFEAVVEEAISADGRGHFLSTYDGSEEEVAMSSVWDWFTEKATEEGMTAEEIDEFIDGLYDPGYLYIYRVN